jgi:hypothetical protein
VTASTAGITRTRRVGYAWYAMAIVLVAVLAGPTARAGTITRADGPTHCVSAPGSQDDWMDLQDGDTCQVVAFGVVRGSKPPIYYQLQTYLSDGQTPETEQVHGDFIVGGPLNDGAGVALLVSPPGSTTLTVLRGWSGGDAVITAPRIVRTPQGSILVLEMSADVSSSPNYDTIFRAAGGKWTQVTDDWSAKLTIPKGVNQRHGNAMDWPTLRAFGAFWKPDDPECCPTGGTYIAQLRLNGNHLRLVSVRNSHGELPFP